MLIPSKGILDIEKMCIEIIEYKCSECNTSWDSSIIEGLSSISYCGECDINFDFNGLKNREWAFKLELLHKLERVGLTKIAVNLTKKYFEEEGLFTEDKVEAPKHVSFSFGNCDYSHCIQVLILTELEYDFLKLMYDSNNSLDYKIYDRKFDNAYFSLYREGIVDLGKRAYPNISIEVKVFCWVCPCESGAVQLLVFREKNIVEDNSHIKEFRITDDYSSKEKIEKLDKELKKIKKFLKM